MIVYEKNNKLNINFENELDENPDIEIGKGEIKLGNSEITANSVLPVPGYGDTGKVPTVQDDGTYALASGGGGSSPLVVTFTGTTEGGDAACDKTLEEIQAAYDAGLEIVAKYEYVNIFKADLNCVINVEHGVVSALTATFLNAIMGEGQLQLGGFIKCSIVDQSVLCEVYM